MRTRAFKSLAAIGALAAFAACTDNTSPFNQQLSGGSYALQTVNGSSLPYSYTTGSITLTIQSDAYTLNSDGTYSEAINETIFNGFSTSPASDAEAGTWSQNGNAVSFAPNYSTQNNYTQYTGSLTAGGTFSHSSLTFSYNGVVWLYNHT
jgi:hypothetical protein